MQLLSSNEYMQVSGGEVGATGRGDDASYDGTYRLGDSRRVDLACGPGGSFWGCAKEAFFYMVDTSRMTL